MSSTSVQHNSTQWWLHAFTNENMHVCVRAYCLLAIPPNQHCMHCNGNVAMEMCLCGASRQQQVLIEPGVSELSHLRSTFIKND